MKWRKRRVAWIPLLARYSHSIPLFYLSSSLLIPRWVSTTEFEHVNQRWLVRDDSTPPLCNLPQDHGWTPVKGRTYPATLWTFALDKGKALHTWRMASCSLRLFCSPLCDGEEEKERVNVFWSCSRWFDFTLAWSSDLMEEDGSGWWFSLLFSQREWLWILFLPFSSWWQHPHSLTFLFVFFMSQGLLTSRDWQ